MALQTYLVHFRDRRLALTVGAGLEQRLARDGHDAVALIPAGDGLGLTRADGSSHPARRRSRTSTPQVIALYEEGLLAKLQSLGLTAYIGIGPAEQPAAIRWGNGGGALLLPVTTAGDLVDAVARHTPWTPHAARLTKPTLTWRHTTTLPGTPPPALTRTLAAAGIAGPLLLATLPATTTAAATHPPATTSTHPSAPASATLTADQTVLSTAPPNTRAFLNRIESAFLYYQRQTGQGTTSNSQATQALENQIMRLVNAFINAQPRTSAQPAQTAASPQAGGAGQTNAGSQGGGSAGSQGSGAQQSSGAQNGNQQDQGQQGQQDQQSSASQNSATSQGSTSGQGSGSGQGSMSGQGTTSGQGSMSSGLGTASSGGGTASSGGGSSASGGTSGGASGGGSS